MFCNSVSGNVSRAAAAGTPLARRHSLGFTFSTEQRVRRFPNSYSCFYINADRMATPRTVICLLRNDLRLCDNEVRQYSCSREDVITERAVCCLTGAESETCSCGSECFLRFLYGKCRSPLQLHENDDLNVLGKLPLAQGYLRAR